MLKTSKAVIHVSESFTIRKIDAKEIASKYFRGEYDNRTLPDFKLKTSNATIRLGKDIGKDASSEVYRFTDRGNNNLSILTTNHALYRYVNELQNGKSSEEPFLRCKYCKRGNLKKPVGMPINMIVKNSSLNCSLNEQPNNNEVIFTVIDSFCDFGCMFSYLKRKNCEHRHYKGPLYMNAEQLLYAMYYRIYPDRLNQSIKEKPEWDLLRENGGPLTDEEFDLDASEYIPIPSVIALPAKKQYLKFHLKNHREN